MSRRDPSAATGQLPVLPLRCTCRHLSPVHTLTTNGRRGVCTGAAWCKCEGFTEATPTGATP